MLNRTHLVFAAAAVLAACDVRADVTVYPSAEIGPIKPMNAVNNGPTRAGRSQQRENFTTYKAARIPFARTHDSINCVSGGAHTCDITAVFPDFSADETVPANYDFVFTDTYLKRIRDAGTEVFFRLGQTIEHGPKKYGTLPPKDFAKWARICEHVIRHYNEGWADGFKWDIRYWEIWNEPDLEKDDDPDKRCWGGTEAEFFEFFVIAAKHLKTAFPALKIGGPALAWRKDWADRFLKRMSDEKVPLDFFSWHVYCAMPERVTEDARYFRRLLDRHGYGKSESILNEWNYKRDWKTGFVENIRVISGLKGAAFEAAVMCKCQNEPVDMLMYYDARLSTVFNGLFDLYTYAPRKGYWAVYAWSRLAERGRQIACSATEQDIYAVAARSPDGKVSVMVSRYTDDDNVFGCIEVPVKVQGCASAKVRVRQLDSRFDFADAPFETKGDSIVLSLEPRAFALVEFQ